MARAGHPPSHLRLRRPRTSFPVSLTNVLLAPDVSPNEQDNHLQLLLIRLSLSNLGKYIGCCGACVTADAPTGADGAVGTVGSAGSMLRPL